jgi:hypothetical protein
VLFFVTGIEKFPTYVALPEHAKPAWLRAIRPLPRAWIVALAPSEVFEGKGRLLPASGRLGFVRRLRRRSWKGLEGWDSSLEFRYKLFGTKTLNTNGLEPRKLEDK